MKNTIILKCHVGSVIHEHESITKDSCEEVFYTIIAWNYSFCTLLIVVNSNYDMIFLSDSKTLTLILP